jgi:hypothetical protein
MATAFFAFVSRAQGKAVATIILPDEHSGSHITEAFSNGMQEGTNNKPVSLDGYVGAFIKFTYQENGSGPISHPVYGFEVKDAQALTPELKSLISKS